jgi:hypothetical protein
MRKNRFALGMLTALPLALLSSCQGVSSEGKEAFAFAEALNKGFSSDVPFGLLEKDPEIPEESWDSMAYSAGSETGVGYQSKTYPSDESSKGLYLRCTAFPIAEEKLTGSYVTTVNWTGESDSTFFGCSISSTPEEVAAALRENLPTIERGEIGEPIGKKAFMYAYFYNATLMKEYENNPFIQILSDGESCREMAEKRGALKFDFSFEQDVSLQLRVYRNDSFCVANLNS